MITSLSPYQTFFLITVLQWANDLPQGDLIMRMKQFVYEIINPQGDRYDDVIFCMQNIFFSYTYVAASKKKIKISKTIGLSFRISIEL